MNEAAHGRKPVTVQLSPLALEGIADAVEDGRFDDLLRPWERRVFLDGLRAAQPHPHVVKAWGHWRWEPLK